MAPRKSSCVHKITRLPFKITINKEDVESEDDSPPITKQATKPATRKANKIPELVKMFTLRNYLLKFNIVFVFKGM